MTKGRLPVTEDLQSLGVQPLGLCWARHGRRPAHVNQAYTIDCFALLWTSSGGVFENRSLPQQTLAEGSCCLLLPGLEHCYGPRAGCPWREWLLFFDGWLPRRLLADGQLDAEHAVVDLGNCEQRWLSLRKALRRGRAEDCCPWVCDCLHALSQLQRRQRRVQEDHPAWSLADAMRSDPARDWDLPAVAAASGMSYTAFRQAFRRLIGRSPHQQLIHERLQLAGRLLTDPQPVAVVCRAVGYADPAHFSRLFSKHFGQSPRVFQQRHAVMRA